MSITPTSTPPSPSRPETAPHSGTLPAGPLRARALVLGILLLVASHVWVANLELARYSFPTKLSPYYNVIFILLLVTLLNLRLARRHPRLALNRLELLAVYAMLSVGSAFHSSDMMGGLVSLMGYPHYFAASRGWEGSLLPYLPRWLVVSDPVALRAFYTGNTTLYHWAYLHGWLFPVACWSFFIIVLGLTLLCITVLVSRQWIYREKLSYSIVELPFQMTAGEPFFRQRLMWLGFAITAAITLLNGLAYWYPSIPSIPVKRQNLEYLLQDRPWSAMGWTLLAFYPFGIALSFMMPQDLSFSCWLFFVLWKTEMVAAAIAGWPSGPGNGFPYDSHQAFGAYAFIGLTVIVKNRKVLAAPLRGLFQRETEMDADTRRERRALLGVIAGSVILTLFVIQMGMRWWVAIAFFVAYYGVSLLASRIRTEMGFPVIDMISGQPPGMTLGLAGTRAFTRGDLVAIGMLDWFNNNTYAPHPMPHMAESVKLADRAHSVWRPMLLAVAVAIIVTVPLSFWAYLDMYYRRGCATAKVEIWALRLGRQFTESIANWLGDDSKPNWTEIGATGVGFTVAGLLTLARSTFVWFPLHPLAYALANCWGMTNLWMPVFIGWLLKVAVLRYGGLKQYRTAIPFFLGLILGEFTIGSLWTILGIVLDVRNYDFWP